MHFFLLPILLVASFCFGAAEPLLKKHNSRPLNAESNLEALDPWETPIAGFFIRNHHEVPDLDPETFVLEIDGLVDKPLKLSLKDLASFKETSLHAVLQCSGNGRALQNPRVSGIQWEKGAVGNAEWTGISLKDVLAKARPKPNARFIRVEGMDKPAMPKVPAFVRSIPIGKAMEADTLLATKMNREPMPLLHGGPLRLVLPRWYGQNWMKWVSHITLTENEDPGFYMKKGYRVPKTPVKPWQKWDSATGNTIDQLRVQSFIVYPRAGATVPVGDLEIVGKTFSGAGAIKSVIVSVDNGRHWLPAKVEDAHADGGWQEFRATMKLPGAGKFTVVAKATDATGASQPLVADWNPGGYLYNAVDRVPVTASKKFVAYQASLLHEKCLTCHTVEMIDEQSLSREAWGKVIDKMVGFGLDIAPEEKTALVAYLADRPVRSELAKADYGTESSVYRATSKAGDAKKGGEIFAANCKECHGEKGQGDIGPRIVGRFVPEGVYWNVVMHGKNRMPGFGEVLGREALGDVRAYLLKAKSVR